MNKNLKSICCIDNCGIMLADLITDSNIFSDRLAQNRADYELLQSSRTWLSKSYESTYIPHIDVNTIIIFNSGQKGRYQTRYLIQSASISLGHGINSIKLSMAEVSNMPFG